jgi:hypothetical protein
MPALLLRFFGDMQRVLANCHRTLKTGREAMIVIGDNVTSLNEGEKVHIPTTRFVQELAQQVGFELEERISITVTRENLIHQNNAITENVVLRLRKA